MAGAPLPRLMPNLVLQIELLDSASQERITEDLGSLRLEVLVRSSESCAVVGAVQKMARIAEEV